MKDQTMKFDSYILGRIPTSLVADLALLFEGLPADVIDYKRNGFRSRFRGFGAFEYRDGAFYHDPSLLGRFNAHKDFHTITAGGPPAALSNEAISGEAIANLLRVVVARSPLKATQDYIYGVNLIRVRANDDFMGAPAPGLHQDGYDFSCHINIARQNVTGGASLIAEEQTPESLLLECELQPGEFVFFNDRTLYHTASAIMPRYSGYETWRDMIIIDVVRASSRQETLACRDDVLRVAAE